MKKHFWAILACIFVISAATVLGAAKSCVMIDGGFAVDGAPPEEKGWLNVLVVDAETAEPIADAPIRYRKNCSSSDTFTCGADGWSRIKLHQEDPDYVSLTTSPEGYVPQSFRYSKGKHPELPQEVVFALRKGISIGGFVLDEADGPIEGATVEFWNSSDSLQFEMLYENVRNLKVTTDRSGYWQCDQWPDDQEEVRVRLMHPDYISDRWGNDLTDPDMEKLRQLADVYVLKPGLTVSGTVYGPDGQPLEGVQVKEGDDWFPSNHGPEAKTNADGVFFFKALKTGPHTFTADSKEYAPQILRVNVDGSLNDLDFSLEAGQSVTIQVTDEQGVPLQGVGVTADTWSGVRTLTWRKNTNKEGIVNWKNAPAEAIEYDVYAKGYMSNRDVALEPSEEIHTVVLKKPFEISGTVVDDVTGEAIDAFKLVQGGYYSEKRCHWSDYNQKLCRDGAFTTTFTEPKFGYAVKVMADGYLPKASGMFKADDDSRTCEIRLVKGDDFTGRVVTADGKPVANVTVYAGDTQSKIQVDNGVARNHNRRPSVKTDADGWFSLPPQAEAFTVLVFADAGYAVVDSETAVKSDIILQPWAIVEGTIRKGDTVAADQGIALNERYSSGDHEKSTFYGHYRTTTDDAGKFRFSKVIAGKYSVGLEIKQSEYRTGYTSLKQIEVAAGQTATVDAGGGGRPVTGQFAMAGAMKNVDWNAGHHGFSASSKRSVSSGLWSTVLRLMSGKSDPVIDPVERRYYSYRIDPDGRFTIEDVAAGSYEISVNLYEAGGGRFGDYNYKKPTAQFRQTVVVPETEDLSEVFDLGTIDVTPTEGGRVYYGVQEKTPQSDNVETAQVATPSCQ